MRFFRWFYERLRARLRRSANESVNAPQTGAELDQFDSILIEELRLACDRGRELVTAASGPGLPMRDVPGLDRTARGLEAVTHQEVSWKLAAVMVRGDWSRLAERARELADDPDVEGTIGYTFDTPQRPLALWDDVIAPMFQRYGRRQPDLEWKLELAAELVAAWRASLHAEHIPRRTIAPLHNIRSLLPLVRVGAETVIRPMTDADREEMWRYFGGSQVPGLSARQLEAWTHVIDDRWEGPRDPSVSNEVAFERISNVVTALRLHHPGVTGTTMLWTRLDPLDAYAPGLVGQPMLMTAEGMPTFADPLHTDVGPDDGPALTRLVERLAVARSDRRVALALRRFDSAYVRRSPEDSLIDFWVAFEALLTPDSTQELSYRAALRIARLVGSSLDEREQSFDLARSSYNARSRVVHGETVKDLDTTVRDTRHLARSVLRAWILNPPKVRDLDRQMLA